MTICRCGTSRRWRRCSRPCARSPRRRRGSGRSGRPVALRRAGVRTGARPSPRKPDVPGTPGASRRRRPPQAHRRPDAPASRAPTPPNRPRTPPGSTPRPPSPCSPPRSAAWTRPICAVWAGPCARRSVPPGIRCRRPPTSCSRGRRQRIDEPEAGATQVIPRVQTGYADTYAELDQTVETPVVGHQRTAPDAAGATRLLPHMRTVTGAYDPPDGPGDGTGPYETYPADPGHDEDADDPRPSRRQGDDPSRHAYYPGRRMNLGVVLLPLRIFLGFISIYAGMGKLCDPVYFDGGERGSMVKWLNTLHPWDVAEPLRQFALQHPVGSGLVIAFLQVVVGVLTILGCWQRVAAVVGALLSAALIVTVSWKTVPAYDAPDIIYLAAWSPLIIAGAPVYSVDGRLAGGAWRRLGPRSDIWELRRYVLRRGALITAVTVGLTLLIGSLLGGAVRDSGRVVVPGPGEAPRNHLPGSPLPQE
ncbi:DoxX family membrane protein, partial [Streptomyces sp. WELS2]|uniref:DoxX family membrane protein n=1 Tax=Streptomyces sp. WELS2 TaxID=2749435 RepID=UPI0037DD21A2